MITNGYLNLLFVYQLTQIEDEIVQVHLKFRFFNSKLVAKIFLLHN